MDTGVDANHSDLDDLDDNPATDDSKVIGWVDYVNNNPTPYDDNGHGTHVAGTISGTGAGGTRTGVAPGTQLLAAKALDSNGAGILSDSILAFQWAVDNGADIISFSVSGGTGEAWETTIENVLAAGVTVIAAAGNYENGNETIGCPACLNDTIAVGATDSNDNIAWFSIQGPVTYNGSTYIKPDVSAPGVSITSTWPGGGYVSMSGTSMATPHVSGTAALMLQANTSLTPQNIKQILEDTAVDLGDAGKDNTYGAGRINAYAAVLSKGVIITNYTLEPNPTNTNPMLSASATSNANITYAEYYITTDPGENNATAVNASDGAFDEPTENLSAVINTTALTDGIYPVFLRARNSLGIWSNLYSENLSIDKTQPVIRINPVTYPTGQSAAKTGDTITLNATIIDPSNNGVASGVKNATINATN
ncbi:MAG: S8 family serine peptidase, partial [Mariprofundales bacterium]|nr:S8 family serine peptidase [Mariprofundales bacterium]